MSTGKHIQFGNEIKNPRKGAHAIQDSLEEPYERVARQNKADAILETRTALKNSLNVLGVTEDDRLKKEKIYYKGEPKKIVVESRKKALNDRPNDRDEDFDDGDGNGFLSSYERKNLDSLYRTSTGVPRFDAYLSQRKEKLRRLQQDADSRVAANMQDKPNITKYKGSQGVQRVPVHKRDPKQFEEQKISTIERAMTQKELDDLKQCTFKPDISKSRSRNIKSTSQRNIHQGPDSDAENEAREPATTVNQLISWKGERDARIAMLRMGQVDGKDTECTFQPSLNSRSRQLTQHRDKSSVTLPLKQNREGFVKDFIEKERQEMFRPKINSNAAEIRDQGYKLGQGVPIKMPPRRVKKEPSPPKSVKSAKKYNPTRHQRLHFDLDEDQIKDRYRVEANPDIIQGKSLSSKLRKQLESQRVGGSPSRSYKSNRELSVKGSQRPRSRSSKKDRLASRSVSNPSISNLHQAVHSSTKHRKSKLFEKKTSRRTSPRSRSRSTESERLLRLSGRKANIDEEIEKIMAKANRRQQTNGSRGGSLTRSKRSPRRSPDREQAVQIRSPQRSRSPSHKKSVVFAQESDSDFQQAELDAQKFDSQHWRGLVKERYELNTRRKVDALIYKDDPDPLPIKSSAYSSSKKVANAFKNLNLK